MSRFYINTILHLCSISSIIISPECAGSLWWSTLQCIPSLLFTLPCLPVSKLIGLGFGFRYTDLRVPSLATWGSHCPCKSGSGPPHKLLGSSFFYASVRIIVTDKTHYQNDKNIYFQALNRSEHLLGLFILTRWKWKQISKIILFTIVQ